MSGTILERGQIAAAASKPPFLQLPPRNLFALRAARLAQLAEGHALGDYLQLLAAVCRAQQQVLEAPPALPFPDPERCAQAIAHDMPPLAGDALVREDAWLPMLDAWLAAFAPPAPANPALAHALERVRAAAAAQRKAWGGALLDGRYASVPAAVAPFVGAALQLAWSHWLLNLDPRAFAEVEDQQTCPACGALPMAGVIHGQGARNGLRYLVCSLCACEWHYVRLKCSHCRSTRKLDYLHLQHSPHGVRAEACPECRHYLKQLYLELEPGGETLSADLASLDLDLLLDGEGYRRQAPNLLLAPGGDG
ncbi:formate dehydrogenase accessory protein FdhE [Pseudomonas sp. GCM10022188]|uniref:formate dehydrogenase accessory protein FdhE n=1 Tax=Pseudomonas TaxID=286 RepID=UPI001E3A006F|nr:formate dehydrogenase accessory protein FdhE [Pseudomonas oryzagri]MCC6074742.1 formate dehydrogenase accessory protein FdhE [Pseudomonas oryzagri]